MLAFFLNFNVKLARNGVIKNIWKTHFRKVAQIPFLHPFHLHSFHFLKKINIAVP